MMHKLFVNFFSRKIKKCITRPIYFKPVVLLCLGFILGVQLYAQDPEYSQFYANPLQLNPAFTGTSELPRLVTNYRNQWPNHGKSYETYSVSYDHYAEEVRGGLGVKMLYDNELSGVISSLNCSFLYAYPIKINDLHFFNLAFEAGFVYKKYNPGTLIFPGMIDQGTGVITGTYPLSYENEYKIYPDFAFGITGQLNEVYCGFALSHLTQPDESVIDGDQMGKLPMKFTLHAGMKSHELHRGLISRPFTLSPNLVYQQQGSFKQVNLGIYMKEDWLLFGLWYRNNLSVRPDAAIAMVGIQYPKFQLGYSFDYTLSNTAAYGYGSHEISLIIYFEGSLHSRRFSPRMSIPQI